MVYLLELQVRSMLHIKQLIVIGDFNEIIGTIDVSFINVVFDCIIALRLGAGAMRRTQSK